MGALHRTPGSNQLRNETTELVNVNKGTAYVCRQVWATPVASPGGSVPGGVWQAQHKDHLALQRAVGGPELCVTVFPSQLLQARRGSQMHREQPAWKAASGVGRKRPPLSNKHGSEGSKATGQPLLAACPS